MNHQLDQVATKPRNINYNKRKPSLGDFHLVRFDIRQLRQLRSIFPGKVQSDVSGITDVKDHETGKALRQAVGGS